MRLSVITRTRARPLLLERAADSVAAARVDGMEWIVVEDSEAPDPRTGEIVRRLDRTGGMETVILSSGSRGRTAAANIGLRAASGTFVHFHDDDDTVEPDFYRSALGFLESRPRYKAVRAMCRRVYEEMADGKIRVLKKKPIYPERLTVSLLDAAEVFAYPPIGSVFDRSVLLDIGGFDESFDVGEDYELLLRFLLKADMGTIPSIMANVHVRKGASDAYANSPIEQHFAEEQMLLLNALLRRDMNNGRVGPGFLLAFGQLSRRNSSVLRLMDTIRRRIGF